MNEKSKALISSIEQILDRQDFYNYANNMLLIGQGILSGNYDKDELKEIRYSLDKKYMNIFLL